VIVLVFLALIAFDIFAGLRVIGLLIKLVALLIALAVSLVNLALVSRRIGVRQVDPPDPACQRLRYLGYLR
jgi:hypothetical protein